MFKDLLRKERQKLWLAAALSAIEAPAVERRAPRVGTIEYDAFGLGEDSRWGRPQDVLAIVRTASGL
jgi:hypothetical protein